MKTFNFARSMWDPAELPMTYTPMCKDYTIVRQEDDCISSGFNQKIERYDYIGIGMPEPVSGDCTVTARCAFENHGAPMIDLVDSVHTDSEGRRINDAHYEIVVYGNGCNIWRVLPEENPELSERPFSVLKVAREEFSIPDNTVVELEVRMKGKRLYVRVNDYRFEADVPDIPDTYFVGATLCEGDARLYELSIE